MKQSMSELQFELEQIIEWFGSADTDIDEAAAKYKRGMELIALLQERLKVTENTVTKLKLSFDKKT
ncbi:exodeoxyribonuclease VII small subunit [Candidatus Saccharibacteria bacterium]|nr:exodeoxyribonuclease VII small subunit [Candidatus Saccharibacteria bacterium]